MLVVGIAGGSGSGKTTVVKRIMERLPEDDVALLPQDAYYFDNSQLDLMVIHTLVRLSDIDNIGARDKGEELFFA